MFLGLSLTRLKKRIYAKRISHINTNTKNKPNVKSNFFSSKDHDCFLVEELDGENVIDLKG